MPRRQRRAARNPTGEILKFFRGVWKSHCLSAGARVYNQCGDQNILRQPHSSVAFFLPNERHSRKSHVFLRVAACLPE